MFGRILILSMAVVGLFSGCGDDGDTAAVDPAVTAASNRSWSKVTLNAACDDDETAGAMRTAQVVAPSPSATPVAVRCSGGLSKLVVNADGSWDLNNGQKTGSLTAADLVRLDAAANALAGGNTQQTCQDGGEIADDATIDLTTRAGATLTAYSQEDRTDRICFIGNQQLSNLLQTAMMEFLMKAQASPTASPTPSPTASPSATPAPTAAPM
jgi:hypothetical protein